MDDLGTRSTGALAFSRGIFWQANEAIQFENDVAGLLASAGMDRGWELEVFVLGERGRAAQG